MIPKEIANDPGVEDVFELGTEQEYRPDPVKVARSAQAIKVGALEQRKADVAAYESMKMNLEKLNVAQRLAVIRAASV